MKLSVKKNDDILLDSMIISHILMVKGGFEYKNQLFSWKHNLEISKDVVQKIKNRLDKYNSKLILLDIVERETINMMKKEYQKKYDNEYVENALLEIGQVKKIFLDDLKELATNALFIFDTQPHDCPNGGALSYVDCVLLKIHVTPQLWTKPVSLLTEDECLQKAAFTEGRETNGIEDVGVTFSQKKEWEEIERFKTIQKRTERLENERLENERLENERLENERLENERLENERLDKLKTKYYFCSTCRISYSESKECPKCGK